MLNLLYCLWIRRKGQTVGYYIFDLDGTLVDSLPGIAKALNRALVRLGYKSYTEKLVRKMVGKGASWLCRSACNLEQPELVSEEEVQSLLKAFMEEYPKTWLAGTVIYEGMLEIVRALESRGSKIAVLSNKPHSITLPLVAELFPDQGFDPVLGHSDRYPRKPDPKALCAIAAQWGVPIEDVTMIGDSLHDAHTAQNAASKLILVGWGYAQQEELMATQAPYVRTRDELRSLLLGG